MTASRVCRSVKKLQPSQRAALGIPKHMQVRYERMHSGWRAILRVVKLEVLIEHDHALDVDPDTGEVLACPFEPVGLDELMTLLIQASLPSEFERPPAVAIDGTDIESHSRPPEPAAGAGARPNDSPLASHSPRTTSAPACPVSGPNTPKWRSGHTK